MLVYVKSESEYCLTVRGVVGAFDLFPGTPLTQKDAFPPE